MPPPQKRLILGLTTAMLALGAANANEANVWRELSALPDGVGYGGMIGGVLEGKLIAAGGSYFDKPIWLQGKKHFSDSIYILSEPDGGWTQTSEALPYPLGHAAFAQDAHGLIVAGGINDEGVQRKVFRILWQQGKIVIRELTDMPLPNAYGAGAVAGDYFYVIGGAQSKTLTNPTAQCWRLSLTDGEWERMPDLPGAAPLVPAASSDGQYVYVFGGIAYPRDDSGEVIPTPLNQVYRFDPESKSWTRIADLPEARVAPSASPAMDSGHAILLAGGYAEVHPGSPETHPGFSPQTLIYQTEEDCWLNGPPLPKDESASRDLAVYSRPMPPLAAPCVLWRDDLILIGGEVLPSIRSGCVLALPLSKLTMEPLQKN